MIRSHALYKRFLALLLCMLLLAGFAGCAAEPEPQGETGVVSVPEPAAPASSESLPPPEPQPIEHRIKFSAVGDNLIHDSILDSAQKQAGGEGYDFNYCYEPSKYFFEQFDINWMNQETLISADPDISYSGYPMFASPPQLGQAVYDAGWRVFAISNNHIYDKLSRGISATLRYWEDAPEDVVSYGLFTGYDDDSGIALQQYDGLTIAYVAFTYGTNGIPTPSGAEAFVIYTTEYEAMEHKVRRARQLADIVVVSCHWGTENSHTIHHTQRDLGQSLANWGADVVIGTHPHVIQDIEWFESEDGRRVLVAHSLGNFLSAQSEPERMVGLALAFELVITEQPDGTLGPLTVENVKAYPTVTQYEYTGGKYYSGARTYMYRDYTDELAKSHPMRGKNGNFGPEYVRNLCEKYISSEFLVLD